MLSKQYDHNNFPLFFFIYIIICPAIVAAAILLLVDVLFGFRCFLLFKYFPES